jgi:adenosine kinase
LIGARREVRLRQGKETLLNVPFGRPGALQGKVQDREGAGIQGAYLLMVNEYEFGMIREKTGLSEKDVTAQVETLVITQGEKGSAIHNGERVIQVPIVPPAQIADPTGVGDAYRAGLVKGLALAQASGSQPTPWEIAGQMGAVSAAYVLEQKGTQNHRYTRAEFVTRYRQHFDDGGLLDAML